MKVVESGRDDERIYMFDAYGLTLEQFDAYVERCKEQGYTVSPSSFEGFYSADNSDGYNVYLHYDDKILKEKYEKQYNNVKFIINSTYHDRFILIDRKRLFHSGASFKDLGKKCFDIHEIDDIQSINEFIGKLPSTI